MSQPTRVSVMKLKITGNSNNQIREKIIIIRNYVSSDKVKR